MTVPLTGHSGWLLGQPQIPLSITRTHASHLTNNTFNNPSYCLHNITHKNSPILQMLPFFFMNTFCVFRSLLWNIWIIIIILIIITIVTIPSSLSQCKVLSMGTCTQKKNTTKPMWPWSRTLLKFNSILEVVEVHKRAKCHQAECSGSWIIVSTCFFALSHNGEKSDNPVLWP